MSVQELSKYLTATTPVLLDVREPWEFDICYIPGSINIPIGQLPQYIGQLIPDNEHIVICHHGIRSLRAIQYLQQRYYNQCINLDGGIDAWARQIDPDMPIY